MTVRDGSVAQSCVIMRALLRTGRNQFRNATVFVLLCFTMLGACPSVAADSQVGHITILAHNRGNPYDQFIEAITRPNRDGKHTRFRYTVLYLDEIDVLERKFDQSRTHIDLLITVGTKATVEAGQLNLAIPTLATLIPDVSFEEIKKQWRERDLANAAKFTSAVFLDQPLERQLDLLQIALPRATHLGVIVAAASRPLLPQLKKLTAARGIKLVARSISGSDSLGKALLSILDDIDVLLALPDPEVHNRFTAANILLTAYRMQVPVIGYSRAYVEAGALFGLYSTPRQIAEQVVQIARSSAANDWRLPMPQFPHKFEIKVNKQVAHSLGLDIPSENALRVRLQDIEAQN